VKKIWLATVAAALHLSSTASQAADDVATSAIAQVNTNNAVLATGLTDLKATLFASRTALPFDNGVAANNCAQYANLLSISAPEESIRSAEIRGEYLVCDAVRLLGGEPFIVTEAAIPANAAKTLFERLDMRTFPSSLRNRTDDKTHTLKTLLGSGTVTMTGDTAEVESGEHFFSLKVVGVVHRPSTKFGGRPQPDEWIVWVGDEIKDGNYKSYRTLIVRPPSVARGGLYTASMYPVP